MLDCLRKVLPESVVDQIGKQFDLNSFVKNLKSLVESTWSIILQAEEELRRYAGPPLSDWPTPSGKTDLIVN
jgi:hypothetical protein